MPADICSTEETTQKFWGFKFLAPPCPYSVLSKESSVCGGGIAPNTVAASLLIRRLKPLLRQVETADLRRLIEIAGVRLATHVGPLVSYLFPEPGNQSV